MYQIDNSSVAGTQPASTPAGTVGFFTDGNPATGVAATVVPAEFLNSVMLELLGILQAAGVQPDKTKSNQVASAINSIVQGGANTYTLDTGTANAYIAGYVPAITSLIDGAILHFLAKTACTGASTLKVDGMPVKPLLNKRHVATKQGQITIGSLCTVQYVATLDSFVLLDVTGAAVPSTIAGYGITDAYTSAQIDALLGAQTRVVSTPAVSGSSSVTTGTVVALTATASALLSGGTIASFTWTLPDGTSSTTAASGGSATKSVTATGSIGTSYVVKVMATDSAGNTSQVATKSIAITNHAAPTTPATITVAPTVYQNSTGNNLSISGSTASDSATLTYSLSQSGPVSLVFNKTSGIAAGEIVTFTAPSVAADTPITISAVAVDSMGGVSQPAAQTITVSAYPSVPGTPFAGGYYAGRLKIGSQLYAVISAPKATGEASSPVMMLYGTGNPSLNTNSPWDGASNTNGWLADTSDTHPAASFCKQLRIGGFSDWHLPSKSELEVMFRNLKPSAIPNLTSSGENPYSDPAGANYTSAIPAQTSVAAFKAGGSEAFYGNYYWTSTSYAYTVWMQHFGANPSQSLSGEQNSGGSYQNTAYARACRLVPL